MGIYKLPEADFFFPSDFSGLATLCALVSGKKKLQEKKIDIRIWK